MRPDRKNRVLISPLKNLSLFLFIYLFIYSLYLLCTYHYKSLQIAGKYLGPKSVQ